MADGVNSGASNPFMTNYLASGAAGAGQVQDQRYQNYTNQFGNPGWTANDPNAQVQRTLGVNPFNITQNGQGGYNATLNTAVGTGGSLPNLAQQGTPNPLAPTVPGQQMVPYSNPTGAGGGTGTAMAKAASVGGEAAATATGVNTGMTPGASPAGYSTRNGITGNFSNPYGSAGNLYAAAMAGDPQAWAQLPDYLKQQFQQTTYNSGGDGGQTTNGYSFGNGGYGGMQFTDQNGNQVVQVDPNHLGTGPNSSIGGHSLIDPSKVTYDPTTGFTTPASNIADNWDQSVGQEIAPAALLFGGAGLMLGGFGALGAEGAAESGGFDGIAGDGGFGMGTGASNAITGAGFSGAGYGPIDIPGQMPNVSAGPIGTMNPTPTIAGGGGGFTIPGTNITIPSLPNLPPGVGSLAGRALGGIMGGSGTGGTNPLAGGSGGTPGNGSGGTDPTSMIPGLIGAGMDQATMQQITNMFNTAWNRGDYNANYRPGQLDQLNQMITNPEQALNDPTYQASRARQMDDLSRSLAARGMSLSGNEQGDLLQLGKEMDYNQENQRIQQLQHNVQLGNPDQMASSVMRSLPFMYAARGATNFDYNNLIQRMLHPNSGGGNGSNPLSGGMPGSGSGNGDTYDSEDPIQYPSTDSQLPPGDYNPYDPNGPDDGSGITDDIWNSIFGGG